MRLAKKSASSHQAAKLGILCLDLGTRTGYALGTPRGRILTSGSIELASAKELRLQRENRGERNFDLRVLRLWEWILHMHKQRHLHAIVFEDVNFFTSTNQLQVWSSLRGAIWSFRLLEPSVELMAVPVGSLKKFACGNGHAQKPAMHAAWTLRPKTYPPTTGDDHEIDALWLFDFFLSKTRAKHANKKT